jgi:hypothetical protein
MASSSSPRFGICVTNFAVFYCEHQAYASMLDVSPDRRKIKDRGVNHSLPHNNWGKERKTFATNQSIVK